jgi:hypothetical protein
MKHAIINQSSFRACKLVICLIISWACQGWFSSETQAQTIVAAEFFINTDPGLGNGTPIAITPGSNIVENFSINTDTFSVGLHAVYIRMQYVDGTWGLAERRLFRIADQPTTATQIVAAEFFINNDPGLGNGTPIAITPGSNIVENISINTDTFSVGLHAVYIRMQYIDGTWGLTERRLFRIADQPTTATQIVAADFFINNDPGLGNGTPITITPGTNVVENFNINTDTFSVGLHAVYIRMQYIDGNWGLAERRLFRVADPSTAGTKQIVFAEMFFNTDPGVGNADVLYDGPPVDTLNLSEIFIPFNTPFGAQHLYVRVQDNLGIWSLYEGVGPLSIDTCDLDIPFQVTQVSCFGIDDGAVSFTLQVPANQLDFNWSDGFQQKGDRANMAPGSYAVTITPAGSTLCEDIISFTINAPSATLNCAGTIQEDVPENTTSVFVNIPEAVLLTPGCQSNAVITNSFNANGANASGIYPAGTTQVVFTATGQNGATLTCNTTVIAIPILQITQCPANIQANTTPGQCFSTQTIPNIVVSGGIPPYTITNSFNGTANASGNYPVGVTNVVFTVTDADQTSVTCSFQVTITDNEAPELICPSAITVNTDSGVCGVQLTLDATTATDNCGIASITNDLTAGGANVSFFFPVGITSIEYTATDVNGNTATCETTVTVTDTEAPLLTCTQEVLQAVDEGVTQFFVNVPIAIATDNCDQNLSISNSFNTGGGNASGIYQTGTTQVIYTTQDVAGNSATCTTTVLVIEQFGINCPQNIQVFADAGVCNAAVTIPLATLTGGVPPFSISNNFTGGGANASGTYPVGVTPVIFTATDGDNETATCTLTVTVIDNQAPVITCPNNITVGNDAGVCGAQVVIEQAATATDNCAIAGITNSQTGGGAFVNDFFPVGQTTITYTATDVNVNTATCQSTVTVNDNEAPVVTCIPLVQLAVDEGVTQGFVQVPLATVSDNCDVLLSITNNQTGSGANASATYQLGDTEVIYSSTDVAGNTGTCTTIVTVVDLFVINCPSPVTVDADQGQCEANVTVPEPTLSGGVGPFTVVNNFNSGGLNASGIYSVGTTIVVFTAEDADGAIAVCSLAVTVTDNEAPEITCPGNVSIGNDPVECGAQLTLNAAVATDNCGVSGITNDLTAGGANVSLFFPVGNTIITYTANDVNGNSSTCQTTVTVNDTEAPVVTCSSEVILVVGEGVTSAFVNVPIATATDNCDQTLSISNNFNNGGANASDTFLLGTTNVIYTSTDVAGNTGTCTTAVTVIDQFALLCVDDIVVSAPASACEAFVTVPQPGTSGGVPPFTITNNITGNASSPSGNYPVGTTQVIFTGTDNDGEVAVCTVNVIVQDVTPPGISCPADVTVQVIEGILLTQVNLPDATATDLCDSNPMISNSFNTGGPDASGEYPPGITQVVFTAMDASGNSASCTTEVNIVENPPLVITCPADISIDCTVDPDDLLLTGSPSISGFGADSANVSYTDVITTPDADCPQQVVITRTFTASEPAGQLVTCVQTITKTDTQAPTVVSKTGAVSLAGAPSFNFTGFEIVNLSLSNDNCGILQVESVDPVSISQVEGCTTIILTVIVSDGCGNTVSISDEVLVSGGTGEVDDATIGPDNIGFTLQAEPCIGLFEIEASGQPTSKIDRMQLVYQEVCGDFEIITKVDELEGPGWAGILARENLSPGSKKIALKTKLNGEIRRDRRDVQDGPQASLLLTIPAAETWLRMVRSGSNWFLYTGSDGINWTLRNSGLQTQSNCVLAGVFTESEIVRVRPPILSFQPVMTRGLFINTVINLD